MKSTISFVVLFFSLPVFPQFKDTVPVHYSKLVMRESMESNLRVLASDKFEGRETAMPGQKTAAHYIESFFKAKGLAAGNKQSFFQTYKVKMQLPDSVKLSIAGKKHKQFQEYYATTSFYETKINASQIYFANYGIQTLRYKDYKRKRVKNKVVMIMDGEPMSADSLRYLSGSKTNSEYTTITSKISALNLLGAKAILVVQNNFETSLQMAKRQTHHRKMWLDSLDNAPSKQDVPVIYINEQLANSILKGYAEINDIKKKNTGKKKTPSFLWNADLKLEIKNNTPTGIAENVLGYVEGTDKKEEVIVITAHYDHIGVNPDKEGDQVFNGADDDGSGTVAVMELAKVFMTAKKEGRGPRRSMLFMLVSGEEKGLLGSKYYANNPVFGLSNTMVNLNIDMIGRIDDAHKDSINYIYLIGADKMSKELHQISETCSKNYSDLKLDYRYNSTDDPHRFYYRSDHYNFIKKGIPAIFYFNGTHADYHKASDEVDKIDFNLMEKRTRLIFFTAWELANRKERIKLDAEIKQE